MSDGASYWRWRVLLALVLVVNTVGMLSDSVAAWWSGTSDDEPWGPIGFLNELRPDLGEADLHAVVWAVAAFIAVMAAGARRWLPWVAAIWGWSVIVELAQPILSETRQAGVGDVIGNTVGVLIGASLAWWWRQGRSSRRSEISVPSGR